MNNYTNQDVREIRLLYKVWCMSLRSGNTSKAKEVQSKIKNKYNLNKIRDIKRVIGN